ncbi:MAG: hypothetical protein K6A97_09850 [Lachnospiraceae bacterium]|nr:hypothetical protein [Lachnospiraceae bacterium]
MDNKFTNTEKLYRAIYPPEVMEMFWKKDGTLSSAAFADANGLSVDRGYNRPESEVITDMTKRFTGRIVSLYVKNCLDIGAIVKYLPSKSNKFHSEIHGSETTALLSKSQRFFLAARAVIVH